jgi:predicted nucleic acid-binding Zn ribbon protein
MRSCITATTTTTTNMCNRYNGKTTQVNIKRLLSVFFMISFLILLWVLLSYSNSELAEVSDQEPEIVLDE